MNPIDTRSTRFGAPRQHDPTQTPEFRRWFKNSQVVDEDGNPLVCYHGTSSPEGFTMFEPMDKSELGTHFGTREQAATFVKHSPEDTDDEGLGYEPSWTKPRIYPVYLSIQNPLPLEDKGGFETQLVLPQLRGRGVIPPEFEAKLKAYYEIISEEPLYISSSRLVGWIKAAGYDGIRYYNRREGKDFFGKEAADYGMTDHENLSDYDLEQFFGPNDAWIIFDPSQAKSIYNRGTWDPSSGNLSQSALPPEHEYPIYAEGWDHKSGLSGPVSPSRRQAVKGYEAQGLVPHRFGGHGTNYVRPEEAEFLHAHGFGHSHLNSYALQALQLARAGHDPELLRERWVDELVNELGEGEEQANAEFDRLVAAIRRQSLTSASVWKRRNTAYKHLIDTYDCGPFDGACYPVARAIQREIGGDLVMMVNADDFAHHAAVLKDGILWDAAGGLPVEKKLAQFNREEDMAYDPGGELVGIRPVREGDLQDSANWAADNRGVDAIRRHFKRGLSQSASRMTQRKKFPVSLLLKVLDADHEPIPEDGKVSLDDRFETPLGTARLGLNQMTKLEAKGRLAQTPFIRKTLEDPSLVIQMSSGAKLYLKHFGSWDKKCYSAVLIKADGMYVAISEHFKQYRNVVSKGKNGQVIHIKPELRAIVLGDDPTSAGTADSNPITSSPGSQGDLFDNLWIDLENLSQSLSSQQHLMYHITPTRNLDSIRKQGLLPSQNEEMGDAPGVYLFPTRDATEEALMNWMSERFDEDEPLILLTIDTSGLDLHSDDSVGYEVWSETAIPPEAIVGVESLDGEDLSQSADPLEVAAGTVEELEHTDSIETAEGIAMDHLKEDPDYYVKLDRAGLLGKEAQQKLYYEPLDQSGEGWPHGISPDDARAILDGEKPIPDGWYIHGRSPGKLFGGDEYPTQFSERLDVAMAYGNQDYDKGDKRRGSVWIARPKPGSNSVLLVPGSPDMEKLIEVVTEDRLRQGSFSEHLQWYIDQREAQQAYQGVDTSEWAEEDRDENLRQAIREYIEGAFAPKDIVEHAGAYDDWQDISLLDLLPGGYPAFVETYNGAVLIPGFRDDIDAINLTELADSQDLSQSLTIDPGLMEALAEKEHERWSGQAKTALTDMTQERRDRWGKLVDQDYDDLTEEMKQKDRDQVEEYLDVLESEGYKIVKAGLVSAAPSKRFRAALHQDQA